MANDTVKPRMRESSNPSGARNGNSPNGSAPRAEPPSAQGVHLLKCSKTLARRGELHLVPDVQFCEHKGMQELDALIESTVAFANEVQQRAFTISSQKAVALRNERICRVCAREKPSARKTDPIIGLSRKRIKLTPLRHSEARPVDLSETVDWENP
jgi:hypothetical protein